jgi:hypothetical protein
MDLRRMKAKLELANLRIRHKAREHHEKIQGRLKEALPSSGEEFGKNIEKKLSSSQRLWSNVSVAFFGDQALERISAFSGFLLGTLMLMLVDIVVIFPTESKDLNVGALTMNFIIVLAGMLVVEGLTYAAMRLMGAHTQFKTFYSTLNTALFMSILVISIPGALVAFAIFSTMLKSAAAINMFFSLIPFYNYLIYGWSTETMAKLKGIKSVILALIALLLILFFNLLLPEILA